MNINNCKLWLNDIDSIINNLPELKELVGKTVLITGCTGLVCSAIVDIIARWNHFHEDKIKIIAAGRDEKKIRDRFKYCSGSWFLLAQYDALSINNKIVYPCEYIIHGASNATPNKIVGEPVETILSNINGLKYLLDYAKGNYSKRVLYISSSEVYGRKDGNRPYRTDEYGYVDLLNARSSYSIGKRAAETLCVAYSTEFGVDTVIVRPGHIYGPTASVTDTRVSSAWAYDVAEGKDIIMKSSGEQLRSYCYCLDCASAIIKVLIKGESLKAYNISNPDSIITIRRMAEILTETASVHLKYELPTDSEQKSFNPMNNSSLDSQELLSLGWNGLFDADRGFAHTVEILKDLLKLRKTGQQGR